MLFLLGAVVATFAAQDLLLFYVSFEAMLIPLYVLVGVWGGERRQAATRDLRHLHDGGLAAHARVGRRVRRDAGDVLADRVGDERQRRGSSSASRSPSRSRRRSSRSTAGSRSRTARRRSRSPPCSPRSSRRRRSTASCASGSRSSPSPADDLSGLILVLASAGLVYGSLLAFRAPDLRGVIAYSSMAQMGLITHRRLRLRRPRSRRRRPPVGRARAHLGEHVPPRRHGRAALRDRRARRARRHGSRPTDARDDRARRGDDRARGARLGDVRRRVPDHGRRLRPGLGLLGRRRARGRARGDVHAPRDLGDPAREARAAPCATRRSTCALGELALVLPLLLVLLGLSVWPALVSESSFAGDTRDSGRSRRAVRDRHADRRLARALADDRAARCRRRRAARPRSSRRGCGRRSPRAAAIAGFVVAAGLAGVRLRREPDARGRCSTGRWCATSSRRWRR